MQICIRIIRKCTLFVTCILFQSKHSMGPQQEHSLHRMCYSLDTSLGPRQTFAQDIQQTTFSENVRCQQQRENTLCDLTCTQYKLYPQRYTDFNNAREQQFQEQTKIQSRTRLYLFRVQLHRQNRSRAFTKTCLRNDKSVGIMLQYLMDHSSICSLHTHIYRSTE